MLPEYVVPGVKAYEGDDRDAERIAEAAFPPTMRFVNLKSEEQLDIKALQRVRSRLADARHTVLNQRHAILFERGHAFPTSRRKRELAVDAMHLEEDSSSEPRMLQLVCELPQRRAEAVLCAVGHALRAGVVSATRTPFVYILRIHIKHLTTSAV